MKKWRCTVCGYIHKGDSPPEKCPVCGADKTKFILMDESGSKAGPEEDGAEQEGHPPMEINEIRSESSFHKIGSFFFHERIRNLLVKHHLHPISVHIPNGVIPLSLVFAVLSLISGSVYLAFAAYINLVAVLFAMPFVIFTGLNEWRIKYGGKLTPVFVIKFVAAFVCFATVLAGSVLGLMTSGIPIPGSYQNAFLLIVIISVLAAGVAGYMGGKLVFKD